MDIQKEIEKFHKIGYSALEQEFTQQEEELRVKKYLFLIINNLNVLQKHIDDEFFKEKNVHYIKLVQDYDYDIGEVFSKVEILNENKEQLNKYSFGNHIPEYEIIHDIFANNRFKLQENLFNQDILKKTLIIELNQHTKEKLKNYLLNTQLRKAYDYVEMLNKVPLIEEKNIKKKKL